MTEYARKTLIGAFVLAALGLFTAVILLMGSGNLFKTNLQFVSFFSSSVQGLVPGSPVYFHGVRVGKVSSVRIDAVPGGLSFRTPVIYEIQTELITGDRMDDNKVMRDVSLADPDFLKELIGRGLRASLATQSIVTGQLAVNLTMEENPTPITPVDMAAFGGIPQIPSVPSSLDSMLETIGALPVQEIAAQTLSVLSRLNSILDQSDIPALSANLNSLMNDLRKSTQTLPSLGTRLESTLASYESLAKTLSVRSEAMGKSLDATLNGIASFSATAAAFAQDAARLTGNANALVSEARMFMKEDSLPMLELSQTMRALRDAAQAVSSLATQLELQPNSLIFGKKGE